MSTSTKARKQRKARANAPLHLKKRMVAAHLDSALMKEFNVRSLPIRKGDTVKIIRGHKDFKTGEAKVASVDLKACKIIVENITVPKADGTQKPKPIDPSDVLITKLDLSDPWRKEKLDSLKRGE
ncbi:MAG: 50S ribosomal protein L24 [Thermoplasmata archaeon]|jgi:large subunit ribosomal protein L24|nr:50S ribosomal protein L24 [Thermoplasmata archaeon]